MLLCVVVVYCECIGFMYGRVGRCDCCLCTFVLSKPVLLNFQHSFAIEFY